MGLTVWQEVQVQPVCGAALAGAAAGVLLLVGVSLLTSCLFLVRLQLEQCPMYMGLTVLQEGQVQPVCGAALAGAAAGVLLLVEVSLLAGRLYFKWLHLAQ